MGLQDYETRSLEELDEADEREVEHVEGVVLEVFEQEHPSTVSELSALVRGRLGEIDNSLIRAAILRLLNGDRLHIGNGQELPAV
jgi:hypothetical protein